MWSQQYTETYNSFAKICENKQRQAFYIWVNQKLKHMSCGSITIGSSADCDNLPIGGTRARVLAINFDDVESYTTDINGVITGINLGAGGFAYEFTGFRNDVKKSDDVIKPDTGIAKFKHSCGWVIYERTQIQKNNVEKLARGRFVIIAENKGKDDDAFEVIGKGVGVEIVAGPIRNAHENGGFFILSFSTPDDQGDTEPKLPQTFFDTDYATTLAAVNALLPAS